MIKIWNVTIKKSTERRKDIAHSIGIEEDNHELIVWKHWVGFLPKNDFFHHIILRQNLYILMDALLKIGTYSICMKFEDKTHLYSANIIGISPYMLENVTGYERHTILSKFQDLAELGYISFTTPTRGGTSEMNILLNEYNKFGLQVFQIEERSWLNERMIVEKQSLFGEYKDIRDVTNNGGFGKAGLVALLPISHVDNVDKSVDNIDSLVESLPIKQVSKTFDTTLPLVESLPINADEVPVDNIVSLVEPLPINRVNLINDLPEKRHGVINILLDSDGLQDVSLNLINDLMEFIYEYNELNEEFDEKNQRHLHIHNIQYTYCDLKSLILEMPRRNDATLKPSNQLTQSGLKEVQSSTDLQSGSFQTAENSLLKYTSTSSTTTTSKPQIKDEFVFNQTRYSTSVKVVALLFQQETGLVLTESDMNFIIELVKFSSIPQIVTAIQSAKVWRATLPTDFDGLCDAEKRQRVIESQPGYYLKKLGMSHIYNFIKNSPRYRKRGKRGVSTGVVSGLNRKRALSNQKKIIREIRKNMKKEKE